MAELDFLRTIRTDYDAIAVRYAEFVSTHLQANPLDRAMLAAFAELTQAAGAGPVADLGCGPGHVTAYLHSLGLTAFGVDLSPEMIALARQAHPSLRFDEGSMIALDLTDDVLCGILARYSIIHTPPERLPEVLAEFHRVLAPGGHLLLSFQAHDEPSELAEAFDHTVSLAYRWSPDRVAGLLREIGLVEVARLVIAGGEDAKRGFPQAHLLARKPADISRS
ncbi:SAM-dependent methyltransferase [Streptosporangium album]|uniref:SAM-dependent methyltransferase n=1 Tax=Streptosporangium album TaxID=47479 RepID=A0A7W7WAI3_9ACTN|nr:methyltransferase domain-containing protein [Streptosporangium album]MBB4939179.1 SAM-dependent methyltransferase [Streptosporangium album]